MFQFQDGAIRREINRDCPFVTVLFQFQDGAIRSKDEFETEYAATCFNSKMVRLEANMYLHLVLNLPFQFQDGAIRSCCDCIF